MIYRSPREPYHRRNSRTCQKEGQVQQHLAAKLVDERHCAEPCPDGRRQELDLNHAHALASTGAGATGVCEVEIRRTLGHDRDGSHGTAGRNREDNGLCVAGQ